MLRAQLQTQSSTLLVSMPCKCCTYSVTLFSLLDSIVLAACAAKAEKVSISAEKIFFFKLCRMLAYPAKFVWIWDGKHKPSKKHGHNVKTETLWGNVQFLVKAFGGVVQEV